MIGLEISKRFCWRQSRQASRFSFEACAVRFTRREESVGIRRNKILSFCEGRGETYDMCHPVAHKDGLY